MEVVVYVLVGLWTVASALVVWYVVVSEIRYRRFLERARARAEAKSSRKPTSGTHNDRSRRR